MGACNVVYYDQYRDGRPIWGTGSHRAEKIGVDNGWVKCGDKSTKEITVEGQRRNVCDKHAREIALLIENFNHLVVKIQWDSSQERL